jgi:hypothetical protein
MVSLLRATSRAGHLKHEGSTFTNVAHTRTLTSALGRQRTCSDWSHSLEPKHARPRPRKPRQPAKGGVVCPSRPEALKCRAAHSNASFAVVSASTEMLWVRAGNDSPRAVGSDVTPCSRKESSAPPATRAAHPVATEPVHLAIAHPGPTSGHRDVRLPERFRLSAIPDRHLLSTTASARARSYAQTGARPTGLNQRGKRSRIRYTTGLDFCGDDRPSKITVS